MANARPNECDTVSDTTSRFGRPNITRPKPSAPSVRKTPTTPAIRRNTVSIAVGAGAACAGSGDPSSTDEVRNVRDLAADLAALVPHLAAERQNVSRDDAARMDHHVAVDGDEVAQQLAVDVGGALHHEQVAGHGLVGADAEVAHAGGAVGHRDADAAVTPAERFPEA